MSAMVETLTYVEVPNVLRGVVFGGFLMTVVLLAATHA